MIRQTSKIDTHIHANSLIVVLNTIDERKWREKIQTANCKHRSTTTLIAMVMPKLKYQTRQWAVLSLFVKKRHKTKFSLPEMSVLTFVVIVVLWVWSGIFVAFFSWKVKISARKHTYKHHQTNDEKQCQKWIGWKEISEKQRHLRLLLHDFSVSLSLFSSFLHYLRLHIRCTNPKLCTQ